MLNETFSVIFKHCVSYQEYEVKETDMISKSASDLVSQFCMRKSDCECDVEAV